MSYRAAIILLQDGQIALIERHRAGQHYFTFPGGHVEPARHPNRRPCARPKKSLVGCNHPAAGGRDLVARTAAVLLSGGGSQRRLWIRDRRRNAQPNPGERHLPTHLDTGPGFARPAGFTALVGKNGDASAIHWLAGPGTCHPRRRIICIFY